LPALVTTIFRVGGYGFALVKYEVDYQLGKGHNYQANDSVDERILGGTNPASIAARRNVAEAGEDNHDYGYHADNDAENLDQATGGITDIGTLNSGGVTAYFVTPCC
jgi:hypothetical protein